MCENFSLHVRKKISFLHTSIDKRVSRKKFWCLENGHSKLEKRGKLRKCRHVSQHKKKLRAYSARIYTVLNTPVEILGKKRVATGYLVQITF